MSSDESTTGGESILSLDNPFTPVEVTMQSAFPPTPPPPPQPAALADEPASGSAPDPASDAYKEEYEARLTTWRAESAEARAKAETERAKWEERRAAGVVPEHEMWEKVGESAMLSETHGRVNAQPGTSVADSRDLVAGEKSGGNGAEALASTLGYPPSAASIQTLETSDASPVNLSGAELSANEAGNTWEEVHSIGSSFPSLPEQHNASAIPLQPTYRARQAATQKKERSHHHRHSHRPPASQPVPPSVTVSVFDSSLSTRTRALALLSSFAINMFLPFVNGVMLGFGEIFARNVVGPWFGWPKPVATSVGVRAGGRRNS